MIVGHVRAGRDPVVRLIVVGRGGRSEEFEALVDTGFNGSLSLPAALTARLNLPVTNTADGRLADGKVISVNSYRPTLIWDGRLRVVSALEMGSVPLIGMALLDGFRLTLDAVDGGLVTIDPLP
jgi:clan AA aspartic protease